MEEPGGTATASPVAEGASPRHGPRIVLEGPLLWTILAAVLIVALGPWMYMIWAATRGAAPAVSSSPTESRNLLSSEDAGPWGRLEAYDIVVAAPLEFVHSVSDLQRPLHWRLRNTSREQFGQMLQQLGLSKPLQQQLLAAAQPDAEGTGLVLSPSDEFIWSLKPDERGKLYLALALDPENQVQANAFRFNGDVEDWFAGSGVSNETLGLIKKLAYRYKNSVFLADTHVLLPRLSKQEQVRVLKSASRQRTYSLRLRVTAEDNIAELADYWGHGRRSKDVRPLLESLARVPGGGTIDVAHLLPPFARMRLYTYPRPSADGTSLKYNSYWTAFNFYAATPDDRFTNLEDALRELKENYYPIYRNPSLGDLVVFSDDADPMFHVAVYVADDFLFTKNGTSFYLPWMYMRLDQMEEFYARPLPIRVSYYRHKDL